MNCNYNNNSASIKINKNAEIRNINLTALLSRKIIAALLMTLITSTSLVLPAIATATTDTDGDYIPDIYDIDDDNDGIRDDKENGFKQVIINGDFEDFDPHKAHTIFQQSSGNAYYFNEHDINGWSVFAPGNPDLLEIWDSGHDGSPSLNGHAHAEVRSNRPDTEPFQRFDTQPGDIITWSLWHRGRRGSDKAVVLLGPSNNNMEIQETMIDDRVWRKYSGTYIVPAHQYKTIIRIKSISSGPDNNPSFGSLIDLVKVFVESDTDGDGIVNRLDLDSDNDGISDLIESGQSPDDDNNNDGIRDDMQSGNDADQNNDGLSDFNNNIGQIPINTDESSENSDALAPDFIDLDSDNDNLPDAVESQATENYISPVISNNQFRNGINASGLVIPVNSDDDSSFDYIDINSDNDQSNDSSEAGFTVQDVSFNDPDGNLNNPAAQLANNQIPSTSEVDFREGPIANIDNDGDGNPNSSDPNPNLPVANDDSLNAPTGTISSINILANDDFLTNNNVNNLGTTFLEDTGNGTATGTVAFNPDTGVMTYTPTITELNTSVSVVYRVCNNASGSLVCANATVTISVTNGNDPDGDGNPNPNDPNPNTAVANNDNLNSPIGISSNINVLANDDFLPNNDQNNLGTTTLEDTGTGTASGTVSLSADTGELLYTPIAAEVDQTVTVIYQACNNASGSQVCDTATVSIEVTNDSNNDSDGDGNPNSSDPNPNSPVANDDSLNAPIGAISSINILANDDFLPNNDITNLGITTLEDTGTGTAAGTVTFNADTGIMTYSPTAEELNTSVSIAYRACNNASGSLICANALVTISVTSSNDDTDGDGNPDPSDPNPTVPVANDDALSAVVAQETVFNVLSNDDFLTNNDLLNLGTTSLTAIGGSAVGPISLSADTGELRYTPTAAEAGQTVTVIYQACNDASGIQVCDTAIASIEVMNGSDPDGDGNPDPNDPNPTVPVANDDALSAVVAQEAVFNVLSNDDFLTNNDSLNMGTTSLTAIGGSAAGTINLSADTGNLRYTPTAAEVDQTVTVIYQACNDASGSQVCDTAIVSIQVMSDSNNDPDGDGNPNPNDPNPNTPVANDDNLNAPLGGNASINVLANDDFLPNNNATNLGTTTLEDAGTGTAVGTVTFDANTGLMTYSPIAAELNTSVTIVYTVCNNASGSLVCENATVTIAVTEVSDPDGDGNPDPNDPNPTVAVANDDSLSAVVAQEVVFNVLSNDDFLSNNDSMNLGTTSLTAIGGSAAGTIALSADTGNLRYTPTAAEVDQTVTVIYQACNDVSGSQVCDTAIVSIQVMSNGNNDPDGDGNPNPNDPNPNTPTANNDSLNAPLGGNASINVLANDDFLPNNNATNLGTTTLEDAGTGTAAGTVTFDANTGIMNYTPITAELNTSVTVVYSVCNNASGSLVCANATVTISVTDVSDPDGDGNPDPNDPNPNTALANDDGFSAIVAQETTFNILTNDDFLPNNDSMNLGTTSLTAVGGSAAGSTNFSADTGEIGYTPTAAEIDQTVTVIYQACNDASGSQVCDTATVSIGVLSSTSNDPDGDGNPNPNDPNPGTPVANDDSLTAPLNGNASINVLANDDFLPNNNATNLGTTTLENTGTGTAAGTVTFDANTGIMNYTPIASELNTSVTVVYSVCNNASGSLVCANATVTITVTGVSDPDGDGNPDPNDPNPNTALANDDGFSAIVAQETTFNILTNDDFLPNNDSMNLGTTSLTVIGGSAAGSTNFSADTGEIGYTPTAAEIDQTVTVIYQACNDASGSQVCDTATVSIGVLSSTSNDPDGDGNPNPNDPNPGTAVANDDSLTAPLNGNASVNVLANDDFLPNNDATNLGTTTLEDTGDGSATGTVNFDANTGLMTYTPEQSEIGEVVTVVYQVCNNASGVNVCTNATVNISVVVASCPNAIDSDNDGLTDCEEVNVDDDPVTPEIPTAPSDPNDPCDPDITDLNCDADNDGIPNSEELGPQISSPRDTDNDGIPDFRDLDSDDDGILDALEAGFNPTAPTDSDGDSIPDYLDPDSDNDGILDLLEDVNSPTLSGNDTDLDGIDDAVDPDQTGGTDGPPMNGVDDMLEPADTDGDGIPNHLDLDSDGDGILDIIESGVPEVLGTDSDGDLIDDAFDVDTSNGNDVNNNGVDDALEPADVESDGKPNYLDLDADNDSIPDAVEAAPDGSMLPTLSGSDLDGDGIDDNVDPDASGNADANGNGISDDAEPVNTDGSDATPDYLDLDSDNDSLLDINEAGNGVDVPEVNDVNEDGLVDTPDAEASTLTPADSDSDGTPDFRDIASNDPTNNGPFDIDDNGDITDINNDGLVDDPSDIDGDGIGNEADGDDTIFGSAPLDTDNDLIPNINDLDDDNDSIPDLLEGFNVSNPENSVDTDGDGIPDYLDVDSDNDGLSDLIEASGYTIDSVDSNLDGLLDYDTDNNGVIDPAAFTDIGPMDGLDDLLGVVSAENTDSDALPDFRDVDSDGDAGNGPLFNDVGESITSGNLAIIDPDDDGRINSVDPRTGQPLTPLGLVDINNDGVPEFRQALALTGGGASSGGGNGSELRTATGGSGSIGIIELLLLVAAALGRKMFSKRSIFSKHSFRTLFIILTVSLSSLLSLHTHAAKWQTGCAYYLDNNNQRIENNDQTNSNQVEFENCWYIGGGIGLSFLDPEGRDINGFASKSNGTKDLAWDIVVGHHFRDHWFYELKYTDLGEADLESNLSTATAAIDYEVLSLMAGYYFMDSYKPLNLYLKAGASTLFTKAKQGAIRREVTSAQFAFGGGIQYRFNKSRWFTRLDVDFYDRDAAYINLSLNAFLGGRKVGEREIPPPPKPIILEPEVIEDCKSFDSVIEDVNFSVDSSKLNNIAIASLLNYARALKKYPETRVMVSAHTDATGADDYNLALSGRRAASVMRFLINSGVSPSQLVSKGYGETLPIANNNTVAGRALNRRVELSILSSKTCY